ncbi:Hypothetical predicted protein [Xyrichtys novacula]|uniref:Uncharacterized protein n=1 Tax=Xyrichtys novacula TaxID=13765 RepID=A0AAV1FQ18_XYRNO|nr:Hypothetical predicted protein [Xyrichtys novacula]
MSSTQPATRRQPHLQRERKICAVTWTDVLRTGHRSCVGACSFNVQAAEELWKSGECLMVGHKKGEKVQQIQKNVGEKIRERKRDERMRGSRKKQPTGRQGRQIKEEKGGAALGEREDTRRRGV